MGATYTRQSSYTDGDVITAAHTNDEFNQLLAAFQASSGHTHDGTANEGGPITKLLGNTLTFGAGTAGTDITITFDGETSDGVLKWMEDEDYFEFSDDILVASTEKLQFRDTAIYINSSTDGQLDLVADTEIQIAATTIDINGNVDISGTLTIGSAGISEAELEILDGATVTTDELNILDGVTSTATELNIMDGDTSASSTTLADADRVVVNDAGTMKQVALTDFETYFESALDTLSNVTTVGALNSGSITSGFGAIDNGSSAITTTGTITYGSLSDGSITITAFVDEDDMSSNSATLVPTQQSVKAYVDTQLTAEDLDFQADSGGALSIDLDSETLTFTGGTGIDTSGSGNAVTFAIDSTVTTLTGSQTLTNKTLTSAVLNGTISGTSIKDEDDMSSNSASHLATQQSIKAYVDTQITAEDLDVTSDSGTIAIDLDSETLTIAGGEGIDTSATSNTVTIAGEDASTSNKGIASFSSDNFAVSSGAVTIKDGGVVTAELAADAVTGAKIADDAIDSEHYTDGSIDTAHIGDLQVTTAKIAADAITGAKIADDAIDSEHYTDGSIDTAHIADSQVTTAKIAADAITEAKIADNAVESEHINDNVISGQTELASGLATTDELLVSDAGTIKRMDVSVLTALTDDNATALAIALG